MIKLPQGITLSEADFNRFVSVFEQLIDKAVEKRLKEGTRKNSKSLILSKKLTNKQTLVLDSLLKGNSNREISVELNLSERAVVNCISRIYKKYNVGSRRQLFLLSQDAL